MTNHRASKPRHELLMPGLLALGLAQMAADALGCSNLQALAAATGASPRPKVFTQYGGLEPFSAKMGIATRDPAGQWQTTWLTPERYARLRGPYNRRNAIGAIVAAAPALAANPQTRAGFSSIARHALCRPGRVRDELGLGVPDPQHPTRHRVVHHARIGGNRHGLPTTIEVDCR